MKILLWIALIVLSAFAVSAFSQDVCRINNDGKVDKTHCQHFRNGQVVTKMRSKKTYDRWMAIPCRQLKKHLPKLDCKKALGDIKFGESKEG